MTSDLYRYSPHIYHAAAMRLRAKATHGNQTLNIINEVIRRLSDAWEIVRKLMGGIVDRVSLTTLKRLIIPVLRLAANIEAYIYSDEEILFTHPERDPVVAGLIMKYREASALWEKYGKLDDGENIFDSNLDAYRNLIIDHCRRMHKLFYSNRERLSKVLQKISSMMDDSDLNPSAMTDMAKLIGSSIDYAQNMADHSMLYLPSGTL